MQRKYLTLSVITVIILASSCTTVVQMQRTYPPEAVLQPDSAKYVFVNFFDYRIS